MSAVVEKVGKVGKMCVGATAVSVASLIAFSLQKPPAASQSHSDPGPGNLQQQPRALLMPKETHDSEELNNLKELYSEYREQARACRLFRYKMQGRFQQDVIPYLLRETEKIDAALNRAQKSYGESLDMSTSHSFAFHCEEAEKHLINFQEAVKFYRDLELHQISFMELCEVVNKNPQYMDCPLTQTEMERLFDLYTNLEKAACREGPFMGEEQNQKDLFKALKEVHAELESLSKGKQEMAKK